MKTFKLTIALSFLILSAISCKKDQNKIERSNDNIILNGAQVAPPNSSSGTGKLQASYSSKTKLLSYTVSWTGLSANVNAIKISGPADPGYAAAPIQSFTSGFTTSGASGTYTNTLFIDGIAAKEADLLNGKYYMSIHTVGTFSTPGEIRGQIVFK